MVNLVLKDLFFFWPKLKPTRQYVKEVCGAKRNGNKEKRETGKSDATPPVVTEKDEMSPDKIKENESSQRYNRKNKRLRQVALGI